MLPKTMYIALIRTMQMMFAVLATWIVLGNVAFGDSPARDALQMWIADHVLRVRSIAPDDENFDDLAPLVEAISSATVVQLGEPSHGAGSSFAAKARLLRFLHQRMGFEVVLWEAGMYDVRFAWSSMQARDASVDGAQQGLLAIWSATQEARPLFEYARHSQGTMTPLEMAGFDLQFAGENSAERFGADLQAFVAALRDPAVRHEATSLANQLLAAHGHLQRAMQARASKNTTEPLAPEPRVGNDVVAASRKDVDESGRRLLQLLRVHRSEVEQIRSSREAEYMEHMIENMRANGLNAYDILVNSASTSRTLTPALEAENRREFVNAQNLHWLISEVYAGRKVIVWAHNAHIMNAYYSADWHQVHIEPDGNSMKPSGMYLAEWFGSKLYTILTTTYQGIDGGIDASPASQIPPAGEGTLESRLHRLGQPYLFLDLRKLDAQPMHPMRGPLSLRVPKYEFSTLQDPRRICDAILYIDEMHPTRRVADEPD